MQFENKKPRTILAVLLPCIFAMMSGGCATNAQTGSLIGAGLGAAIGQWIGGDTEGTLIGAGVGTAAGYMIGNEADKEEARNNSEIPPGD